VVKPLFDTNILIDYLRGIAAARSEIDLYDDRGVSIISWIEVMVGADEETAPAVRAFLASFEVLGLDAAVADLAVDLRRRHRLKLPDACVWATARRHGRLLVTREVKDFPADDPGIRMPYSLSP
jgi:predicted nucleic acid-binding protein